MYEIGDHLNRVGVFMSRANQVTSNKIRVPSAEERILRAKLIYEEVMEIIESLGIDYCLGRFIDAGEEHFNPKGILDGACDIAVVTNGTLLSCGLWSKFDEALLRVDENNLSKVNGNHKFREDGKVLKPPEYVPVVLDDLIESMT